MPNSLLSQSSDDHEDRFPSPSTENANASHSHPTTGIFDHCRFDDGLRSSLAMVSGPMLLFAVVGDTDRKTKLSGRSPEVRPARHALMQMARAGTLGAWAWPVA